MKYVSSTPSPLIVTTMPVAMDDVARVVCNAAGVYRLCINGQSCRTVTDAHLASDTNARLGVITPTSMDELQVIA